MDFLTGQRNLLLVAAGGAGGIGKTTTLRSLVARETDIEVIYMATELDRFSIDLFGKRFFGIDIELKDAIREKHGQALISRLGIMSGVVILDLHFTDARENRGKIIQPELILRNIDMFVCFDAPNELILDRILNDKRKIRVSSLSYIERDRIFEEVAARKLAETYNKEYIHVRAEGSVNEIANEFRRQLWPRFLKRGGGNEREY